MEDSERNAWFSLKFAVTNFLDCHQSADYECVVNNLLQNFKTLGAHMPVEMHFLNLRIDSFPDDCGNYSEEQGECFRQGI